MGTIKIFYKNKNKIMKKVNKLYQTTIDLRTPREKELKKEWKKMGIIPKYDYFTILYRTILIISLLIILINSFKTNEVNANHNPYKIYWINREVPKFLYDNLKFECDKTAMNPKHCLKTWLSIAYAESTWGNWQAISYNYFWLTSIDKSIWSWVMRYNKYWYKSTNWFFFYWDWWKLWASHYCTEEHSSWSNLWCPNWRKNFNYIYNKLK